jgi:hypothetical protein
VITFIFGFLIILYIYDSLTTRPFGKIEDEIIKWKESLPNITEDELNRDYILIKLRDIAKDGAHFYKVDEVEGVLKISHWITRGYDNSSELSLIKVDNLNELSIDIGSMDYTYWDENGYQEPNVYIKKK